MLFPKEKLQITTSYEGRTSDEGWLVLDFSKIDTDGITRVYVDLEEVRKLQQKQSDQTNVFKKTLDLLKLEDE